MPHGILIVDDEAPIREELEELLGNAGYSCRGVSSAASALEALHEDSGLAIVLTDIRMPGQDGLELITTANAEIQRDLECIIMTGHGGTKEAIEALRLGAQDFLEKPISPKHLLHVVERADRLLHLRKSERLLRESLKAEVEAKTLEVSSLLDDLGTAYEEALDILAVAAEYKDPETGSHIRRIGAYSGLMASELGWKQQRKEFIELASPLHDVGKIATADAVLLKAGKLNVKEMEIIKEHCEIGNRILSRSGHPVMRCAANIAWAHHERWDGSGYPRGLRGKEIPLEARIVAVADIYDALRSRRPYKPAFDHEKARSIILDGDGRTDPSHFDPEILAAFRNMADEFAAIFARLAD